MQRQPAWQIFVEGDEPEGDGVVDDEPHATTANNIASEQRTKRGEVIATPGAIRMPP